MTRHRSAPAFRAPMSQSQLERARGPILPPARRTRAARLAEPSYPAFGWRDHLAAWAVATLGSAVVVGFVAGVLAVVYGRVG